MPPKCRWRIVNIKSYYIMSNVIEHKGYLGSVEFSSEDGVFFGKILGLNDLVTFEGESVSELKTSFIEAVEDYLETCKEIGKAPEKTYKGTFNVRVPSEIHKQAVLQATTKNMTLNEFVKFALSWVLQHRKEVEPELKKIAKSKKEFAC